MYLFSADNTFTLEKEVNEMLVKLQSEQHHEVIDIKHSAFFNKDNARSMYTALIIYKVEVLEK